MRPVAPAELAAFYGKMADLDKEIQECYDGGYDCDTALEERLEWQRERDEYFGQ